MDVLAFAQAVVIVLFIAFCFYSNSAASHPQRLPIVNRFAVILFFAGLLLAGAPRLSSMIFSTSEPVEFHYAPLVAAFGAMAIAVLARELHSISKELGAIQKGLSEAQGLSNQPRAT